MPLGDYGDFVERWDGGLRAALQSVVSGVPITDRAIACLPTALGGLGLPALADYADAAFVARRERPETSPLSDRCNVVEYTKRFLSRASDVRNHLSSSARKILGEWRLQCALQGGGVYVALCHWPRSPRSLFGATRGSEVSIARLRSC